MMGKEIEYVTADPAGNKTILVLTEVSRDDYQNVARKLLESDPEAEQVGFIKEKGRGGYEELPYMEMCGLEFCGNASRAFAYYEATKEEPPMEEITVCVSGSDKPLNVKVDVDAHRSMIEMPVPVGMRRLEIPVEYKTEDGEIAHLDVTGNLVEMEGIAHFVVTDVPAEKEIFQGIKEYVYKEVDDFPAFGVMFLDISSDIMTPVVYVRDVDTLYFEGSCASGSVAAAYARNATCCVPVRTHILNQPAGTLEVEVHVEKGKVSKMLLDGDITISEKHRLDLFKN